MSRTFVTPPTISSLPRPTVADVALHAFPISSGVIRKTKDDAARSSEHANELIQRMRRDFTNDPIQAKLIEYTSTLIRQIQADDDEGAINELIVKLGGDPVSRTLKPIGLVDATGKNRWTLHDLRRKANQDIQRAGGSLREQMALTGHKSVQVNVLHCQSADPDRMRQLVGSMSGFKGLRLIWESA